MQMSVVFHFPYLGKALMHTKNIYFLNTSDIYYSH